MTELTYRLNQQPPPQSIADQEQVRRDMNDLKELVHQQAISIDNLSDKLDRLTSSTAVEDRLKDRAL